MNKPFLILLCAASITLGADPDLLRIDARKVKNSAPGLYGAFFEEINHAGDGGLYAELIQNRSFEETLPVEGTKLANGVCRAPASPHYIAGTNRNWSVPWKFSSPFPGWSLEGPAAPRTRMSIETTSPMGPRNPNYLRVVTPANAGGPAMLLNSGYWGVPVKAGETYDVTFYARAGAGSSGTDIRTGVINAEGDVLGSSLIPEVTSVGWKKYTATFQAKADDRQAHFFLQPLKPGTLDVDLVSLFPRETFRSRPNGLRQDLAQMVGDLKPGFLRFPGGCVVEGATFANRYRWKETIGDISQRPGHWSLWGYRNSDGLGYHEFLQFCEDIGTKAMFVCSAGMACEFRNGDYVPEGRLQELVDSALDAIEYALGSPDTRWGAERVRNGHPGVFPLAYLEIGNENHGPLYDKYYARIAAAVRRQWPQVKLVYNGPVAADAKPPANVDIIDEHFYRDPDWFFMNAKRYDALQASGKGIYIGEFACNRGVGNGNVLAALSEAAFMLGLERNPQTVKMASYAPLLFNVNRLDWPVNLIGFDGARAFGRSSYYVQKLLAENLGDTVLGCEVVNRNTGLAPAFAGAYGLSAWGTDVEFRNFEVESEGKFLHKPDFSKAPGWVTRGGGLWQAGNGVYRITGRASHRSSVFQQGHIETGVIRVQARKLSGTEGFQVVFGDSHQEFYDLNISGWKNTRHGFEQTVNGKASGAIGQTTAGQPVETNRWYDVRVEIGNEEAIGFLDEKEVARMKRPGRPRLVAGASMDRARNEMIIKVVNGTAARRPLQIQLNGAVARGAGQKTTLAAKTYKDENTIDAPLKILPRVTAFLPESNQVTAEVDPWSLTIFRFPAASE